MSRTILIMAGGTGGHIFPAIAVADYLRERHWSIVWLGTKSGMEAKLIPQKGYQSAWISFSGLRGAGVLRWIMLPIYLAIACAQSACALFRFRPDVVLGMGGFAAFPGGLMASFFRKPLVIHEQNSIAGLSNRALSALAQRILLGFPAAFTNSTSSSVGRLMNALFRPQRKALWCGNPVRDEIIAIAAPEHRLANRQGKLRFLVVGGSLGAQALNQIVPAALALIAEAERPSVIHQSGEKHFNQVKQSYGDAAVEAVVVPFLADIATRYADCDLLLCRAGALTVAEITAAGIASILVPYPHAVDDHQTHNAKFLSEQGAAILIPQSELNPTGLAQLIRSLTRAKLLEIANRARGLAKPDATRLVAEACMECAQ
jgi:UDP-N-acetylglucosamine--N-acetylmuramyl-(pentapeptide) pyrophosphoryl-undecaprenol N-acetylglucosamine transferase